MGQVITPNHVILSHVKTESGKLVVWKDEVINSLLQRIPENNGGAGASVFTGGIPIHHLPCSTTSGGIE